MTNEALTTVSIGDRVYLMFDDGDGVQIWAYDERYGVLETLPEAPDPYVVPTS